MQTVGSEAFVSDSRTSSTGWLQRKRSPVSAARSPAPSTLFRPRARDCPSPDPPLYCFNVCCEQILDHIYGRLADVLNVDNKVLHSGERGIAEDLQIVRYDQNQQYMAHYDFGQGDGESDQHDRCMTLLLYIQPAEEGGGTSFPKASVARTRSPSGVPAVQSGHTAASTCARACVPFLAQKTAVANLGIVPISDANVLPAGLEGAGLR